MATIITTAGMAKGTPDWQLDRMYEEEVAQAWEKSNEQPPQPLNNFNYDTLISAWASLETGEMQFELLEDNLAKALQHIEGSPESDKLAELYDSMVDIRIEAMRIKDTLKQYAHKAWTERRFAG